MAAAEVPLALYSLARKAIKVDFLVSCLSVNQSTLSERIPIGGTVCALHNSRSLSSGFQQRPDAVKLFATLMITRE